MRQDIFICRGSAGPERNHKAQRQVVTLTSGQQEYCSEVSIKKIAQELAIAHFFSVYQNTM